jgi:hypothetical protein
LSGCRSIDDDTSIWVVTPRSGSTWTRSFIRTPLTKTHSPGTHPEYSRKSDALQRVRDRRVFAAERFKQMQMDNIQGLYEYEVLEAEASYKVRRYRAGWFGGRDWLRMP